MLQRCNLKKNVTANMTVHSGGSVNYLYLAPVSINALDMGIVWGGFVR